MDSEEIAKVSSDFERINQIIRYNNSYIIELISFYENFILEKIIKPFYFNENINNYKKMNDFIRNRMNFMDRFKIVVEIARNKGIKNFKGFDDFVKMRNEAAHNLIAANLYDIPNKEFQIYFEGKIITWERYCKLLEEWAELSLDMATFIRDVFKSIKHYSNHIVFFDYCKVEECTLIKQRLILSSL